MAEQFSVSYIPGAETGEIPPSPVDRDEKTAFIYSLVDPIWDIDTLPLDGHFGGPEVRSAMQGHILGQASLTGTYTLNPQLQK